MLDAQNTCKDTRLETVTTRLINMANSPVLSGPITSLIQAGGGMVRARLTLRAADAMGVDGVPLATSVEALHLASLIHDDVCDGADTRRGIASINAAHGPGMAIAAGDLLIANALAELATDEIATRRRIRYAQQAVALTIRGQVADVAARGQRVSVRGYLAAAARKCGPLLGLGPALVSVTADAPKLAQRSFRAARWLAIAYQIADDLNDQAEDGAIGTPNFATLAGPATAYQMATTALDRAKRISAHLPAGVDDAFANVITRTDAALAQARHAF